MNRLLNRANKRVSLGNAAMLLITVAFMGQVLGFLRNRLVVANFIKFNPGSTDAFFTAFQIPDFFFFTIAAGALGVAFLPVLADRLHKGDRQSIWDLTNSLLNLLMIVMFVVAAVIFVFARPLLHYLPGPGLNAVQLNEATVIMRLVAINPLLFTLSGILTSMQQTFGRFFFYAIAPLFYNLAIILSIYLFKHNLGIVGLGVGALVGALLQLLISGFGLWGLGFRYKPKILFRSKDFKLILSKLPARSIDQGVDQINSIVETNRASRLATGSVSYYNLATTLMNVPVTLFGTSIATAAFPHLTERLAQKRPDLFHKDFFAVLRTMIWIAMPVVVVSYFTRAYLARLVYGDVSRSVSLIFGYLTVAIFFRIIYSILSRYFYAQKDTKTPLFVSLFVIALNIYLAFTLARPAASGGYDIAGLALAQSIAATTEVFILIVIMLIRDPYIFNAVFWKAVLRIISVTGFSVLTAFIMISLLPLEATDKGFVTLGFKFGFIALVTLLMHLGISALFGLEEAKVVASKAYRIILRPIRIQ